jgi:hypothetical protein
MGKEGVARYGARLWRGREVQIVAVNVDRGQCIQREGGSVETLQVFS